MLNIYDPRHGYSLKDLKNFRRDLIALSNDLHQFRGQLDEPVAVFQRQSMQVRRRMYKRIRETLSRQT